MARGRRQIGRRGDRESRPAQRRSRTLRKEALVRRRGLTAVGRSLERRQKGPDGFTKVDPNPKAADRIKTNRTERGRIEINRLGPASF